MSLVTDARAIIISDGDDSYRSYGSSGSGGSGASSESSGEILARHAFAGQGRFGVTNQQRELEALLRAQGHPSPSSSSRRQQQRQRQVPLSAFIGAGSAPSPAPGTRRWRPAGGGGEEERELLFNRRGHSTTNATRDQVIVDTRPVGRGGASGAEDSDQVYLEKLRARLAEMKMSEEGGGGGRSGGAAFADATNRDATNKRRSPARKPDKVAQARLLMPNAAAKARQQIPYAKARELEEKQERERAAALAKSQSAVEAGKRLHAQARTLQRQREEMLAEKAKQEAAAAEERDTECTFRPTISDFAHAQAFDRGHVGVAYRASDATAREEERRLRHMDLEARRLGEYTFQPRLSPGSQQILREREGPQAQRRGRSQPLRRSASCPNEPFDPAGERLYLDGGERLLRQQIRQREAERAAQQHVIGAGMRLSPRHAAAVTRRMEDWRQERDRNLERLREEAERRQRQRQRQDQRRHRTTAGEPLKRASSAPTSGGGSSRATSSGATPSSATGGDRFAPPDATALQREMRLIRFGALFYKYAYTSSAESVRLRDVRREVARLYPEDAGIVTALQESLRASGTNIDGNLPITKPAFVEALASYERRHGSQPWGRTAKDHLLYSAAAPPDPPSHQQQELHQQHEPQQQQRYADPTAPQSLAAFKRSATRSSSCASKGSAKSRPASRTTSAAPAVSRTVTATATTSTRPPSAHSRRSPQSSAAPRSRGAQQPSPPPPPPGASTNPDLTFRPTLSKRTAALSELDKRRRENYARQRSLRREQIDMVLTAATPPRRGSEASAGQPPPSQQPPPPPHSPELPSPVLARGPGSVPGGGGGASRRLGLSPSVDLSTLSASSSVEVSAATPQVSRQQQQGAATPGSGSAVRLPQRAGALSPSSSAPVATAAEDRQRGLQRSPEIRVLPCRRHRSSASASPSGRGSPGGGHAEGRPPAGSTRPHPSQPLPTHPNGTTTTVLLSDGDDDDDTSTMDAIVRELYRKADDSW